MLCSFQVVRPLIAFVLFLSLLAPLAGSPSVQARDVPATFDIAAMSFATDDLDDAGFEGFALGIGEVQDLEGYASLFASEDGNIDANVREVLADAGFLRSHSVRYYGPGGTSDFAERWIISTFALFEDADGAELFFEEIEEGSTVDEIVDGWDDFGDQSLAIHFEDEDGDYRHFDVNIQIDNLILIIRAIEWEGEEIDEDALEELADIAIDRIRIAQRAEQPALSNMVLRYEDIQARREFYYWRGGEINRIYGDADADVEAALENYQRLGISEDYGMSIGLVDLEGNDFPNEFWYYLTIFRFEDEESAEDWMAARPEELEERGIFDSIEFEERDLGDESFLYEAEGHANQPDHYSYAVVRVGEIVLDIGLGAPVPVRDALEAVIEVQVTCIEEGGCTERIALPRALERVIDRVSGGEAPTDAVDATEPAGDDDDAGDRGGEDREIPGRYRPVDRDRIPSMERRFVTS